MPTRDDIDRLAENTPRQEYGRFQGSELSLARANKSLRSFEHVVERLSAGQQPDIEFLARVGYLMRTTAVYGSGKFGCAVRDKIAGRPETRGPFQAEMLAVYLIRWFTIELVEHIARQKGGEAAVALDPAIKRFLGIGNATGLGMAPFLLRYPILVNNWVAARETALARVRELPAAGGAEAGAFRLALRQATAHVDEWAVDDVLQTQRIVELKKDLKRLADWCMTADPLAKPHPWDALYRFAEENFSLEGQELTVSLLLEPHGDLIDDLTEGMSAEVSPRLDPAMTVADLRALIDSHYGWALAIDFDEPAQSQMFWYYSEDKWEPRLGDRFAEPGADMEMPLGVGRDVKAMAAALDAADPQQTVAAFLLGHPEFRNRVRRVQCIAENPYGEIYDNVIGAAMRPIDLLRFKLAFFGAGKFDPKSDKWIRITMYQGAPMPDDLGRSDADNWIFPTKPEGAA